MPLFFILLGWIPSGQTLYIYQTIVLYILYAYNYYVSDTSVKLGRPHNKKKKKTSSVRERDESNSKPCLQQNSGELGWDQALHSHHQPQLGGLGNSFWDSVVAGSRSRMAAPENQEGS